MKSKSILFSVGELSADMHASRVVRVLRKRGNVQCWGMGRENMRAAGAKIIVDSSKLACTGLYEPLRVIYPLWRAYQKMVHAIRRMCPDLVVLVDFGGFNMLLAKHAHQAGVRVLYYILPQAWATRSGRTEKIRRYVDSAAVILPFEKDFYESAGVCVRYVGNPVVERVQRWRAQRRDDAHTIRQKVSLNCGVRRVLLMLGSRRQYVLRHVPLIAQVVPKLQRDFQGRLEFLILKAAGTKRAWYQELEAQCRCKLVASSEHYAQMEGADLALCIPGTTTLELALFGVPSVVFMAANMLDVLVVKYYIRYRGWWSLPNILAKEEIFEEKIGPTATVGEITDAALQVLNDRWYAAIVRRKCKYVSRVLGDKSVCEEVVAMIGGLVPSN